MKKVLFLFSILMITCFVVFAIKVDSTTVVTATNILKTTVSAGIWVKLALWGGILFVLSEGLSMIPAIKANGVFQFIFNILKWAFGGFAGKV